MVERVSGKEFHAAGGVEDWRVLFDGVKTYFATGSFAKGVELVDAIGALADAADHHPSIELTYGGVTVTLFTHEIENVSDRDVAMARQISMAARDLGIAADPSRVQTVQITFDAMVIPEVLPFWCAVLGYTPRADEDGVDPLGHGPDITFQQMDAPRPQRNRIHVDLSLPRDQAEARVAAGLAAGGVLVTDRFAPHWWTLADAEGNEIDIAPWQDDAG